MIDGITVKIHGDFGPFSRMGKSIGYQIIIGNSDYLIDCGAPLFQKIGGHGLKEIDGLIVTHCHDDHKRWFTDLILFHIYAPDIRKKLSLFTSEALYEELIRASGPSLDRSLSKDSRNIIDIPYEDYIEFHILGPRARYKVSQKDEGRGKTGLYVIDSNGNTVGPDMAKIVINQRTKRTRMLFKDPIYKEWIEPDSFYTFSSCIFYEDDKNIYKDKEGFTLEAINAPVWHGITGIGLKVKTDEETLIFSSDTVNNEPLWKELYSKKRPQRLNMSRKGFESATVIYGDINSYIERIWSEERYKEAATAFDDATIIHDLSVRNSVVHTDYERLEDSTLKKDRIILTHSPDKITSEWALSEARKTFRIKGNSFSEIVNSKPYPMNADIYHKEGGRYFIGYRRKNGRYAVYKNGGLLSLSREAKPELGAPIYNIDLYEDVSGRYFPKLDDPDSMYLERKDGRVEIVRFAKDGSNGRIIKDHRGRLSKRRVKG